MDFSDFITEDDDYGENFSTYKQLKLRKYKATVNNLYKKMKVNDLMKLRLSINEIEASKLSFF